MKDYVMTITTKTKISEREWGEIYDHIMDILDKKLITSGSSNLKRGQHKKIWELVNGRKL